MADDGERRGEKRRRGGRALLVALLTLLLFGGFALLVAAPVVMEVYRTSVEPGLGLKNASVIGFFATIGLFVFLALIAGDGLVGEFEVMIGAFFGFFLLLTLLAAWVF